MTSRVFLRHLIFNTLYAIEKSDGGDVLAALHIADSTACRHRLHEYALSLDDAVSVREHLADFEPFDPPCSDARHILADIGIATRAADRAEKDYDAASHDAKAKKEIAEKARAHVLSLTRDATNPRPLPLFDNLPKA